MSASLRIVVADDEPDIQKYFNVSLRRLGHDVVGVAQNGRDLVEQCRALQPDLVVSDIKMPEMDGVEAAMQIYRERPIPFVLVSAYHNPDLLRVAAADRFLGYLVKPIKFTDLGPAIAHAIERFERFKEMQTSADGARETMQWLEALEDFDLVEQAKRVVMQRERIGAQAAFERLQELARQRGQQVGQTARHVLRAELGEQAPSE